jgi:hypothetical protein
MNTAAARLLSTASLGGVQIVMLDKAAAAEARTQCLELAASLGLAEILMTDIYGSRGVTTLLLRLQPEVLRAWMPDHDTAQLHRHLGHDPQSDDARALDREIFVSLLAAPLPHVFVDVAGLASAIRVRRHITLASRRTALAFKTSAAERPEQYWRYDEDHGFILQPGADLIEALTAATQPEATGKVYDFSCYRASEYVILLGLAIELREHNPELFHQLQRYNERHAIRSGLFHEVYLVEYGLERPLPMRYYVPGDRLWFRNPDPHSSDASGFEGSWLIYMGGGLFSNFWVRNQPFTIESKCLEVYHWRHSTYVDAEGELRIDERKAGAMTRETERDPEASREILERMMRLRDPAGVYAHGGCIDSTREYPRAAIGTGCEIRLPPIPL